MAIRKRIDLTQTNWGIGGAYLPLSVAISSAKSVNQRRRSEWGSGGDEKMGERKKKAAGRVGIRGCGGVGGRLGL